MGWGAVMQDCDTSRVCPLRLGYRS